MIKRNQCGTKVALISKKSRDNYFFWKFFSVDIDGKFSKKKILHGLLFSVLFKKVDLNSNNKQ